VHTERGHNGYDRIGKLLEPNSIKLTPVKKNSSQYKNRVRENKNHAKIWKIKTTLAKIKWR